MTAEQIYLEAYRLLDSVTPLGILDCGQLCGKSCCTDHGREDAGMYLFPGEEVMYTSSTDWLRIEPSAFVYGSDNRQALIAMCPGRCVRSLRPLSCRIFPLVPYWKEQRPVQLLIDPRAKSMCPLARVYPLEAFNLKFVETVGYVMRVLARFASIKAFLKEQSELLDEYLPFWNGS